MQLEAVPDDDDASIPKININLVKIATLEAVAPGMMVDVMGVVEACEDVGSISRRDGTEAKKRNLTLRDDSNSSIDVTLWGERAEDPGAALYDAVRDGRHPVMVLKSAPPLSHTHHVFAVLFLNQAEG